MHDLQQAGPRVLYADEELQLGEFICPTGDTSTTVNENFGFDAVGISDTNGNGTDDYLVSAASLDTVYLIDGRRP